MRLSGSTCQKPGDAAMHMEGLLAYCQWHPWWPLTFPRTWAAAAGSNLALALVILPVGALGSRCLFPNAGGSFCCGMLRRMLEGHEMRSLCLNGRIWSTLGENKRTVWAVETSSELSAGQ